MSELINLQSLPFELIMEIINFLPNNFLVSDRFIHLLIRLLSNNHHAKSSNNFNSNNNTILHNYAILMKKRLKQGLFDEHYIIRLSLILENIGTYPKRKVNEWNEMMSFLNPDHEFDQSLMLKVLFAPLRSFWTEMPTSSRLRVCFSIDEFMRSNLERVYREMDMDWDELSFIYKFIERNSYCCLCSKVKSLSDEERIRTALSKVGGQLNFEWYFCNNEEYRNRYYDSQIPGILKLTHLHYDLPFKVRGILKLDNENKITYSNLWVKKPEIYLEPNITDIHGLGASAVIKHLSKPSGYFFDNDSSLNELVSQLYWFPSSCKPNHIIRAKTSDLFCISEVFSAIDEPSQISKFCNFNKHLFKSKESILAVEVDINVYKNQKDCKLIPKSPLFTFAPFSLLFILALALNHFSCLLNFRLSREFFARHNLSWTESLLFVIGDVTAGTIIGYLAKAYYSYQQGYFWESHISLLETAGNIGFLGWGIKCLSQIMNSYYTRKSKLLPIFEKNKQ